MSLYDKLLQRKINGNPITIHELNQDMLYQLFIVEDKRDSEIAILCENQNKNNIRSKRNRLGITLKSMYDFDVKLNNNRF